MAVIDQTSKFGKVFWPILAWGIAHVQTDARELPEHDRKL